MLVTFAFPLVKWKVSPTAMMLLKLVSPSYEGPVTDWTPSQPDSEPIDRVCDRATGGAADRQAANNANEIMPRLPNPTL
jgi:hypothetical protein